MTTFYGSEAGADAYHTERGNTAWSGTAAEKEAALLRASEYIDWAFLASWREDRFGYRTAGRSQDREWPRTDAYVWTEWTWVVLPDNEVPIEVINATYEAALLEIGTPGYFTPDYTPGKAVKRAAVSGAVSVEYWSDDQYPVVRKIGLVLSPLLTGQDGSGANPLSGKVNLA
ncbi:MAG TPA: DnaT-like ssDNA-binding protein [Marinobacter sp.]|nr:DnaT-like ssDNA-binding protein [Marinobacter sp.]